MKLDADDLTLLVVLMQFAALLLCFVVLSY